MAENVQVKAPVEEAAGGESGGETRPGTQVEKTSGAEKDMAGHLQKAVGRYRSLLLSTAPDVPEELVKGETVEEVDASFNAARDIVEHIRQKLRSQIAAERVPTGAPPRTARDVSTLSPKDKIVYGLAKGR